MQAVFLEVTFSRYLEPVLPVFGSILVGWLIIVLMMGSIVWAMVLSVVSSVE